MDIKNLKRSIVTIEGGQWVGDIPNFGDVRLHVRGMTSKIYTATVSRLSRAVPPEGRGRDNTLLPESAVVVMGQALAEVGLLGWEGLTEDGEPLEYSKLLAADWLTNPEFRPFLDAVVYACSVVDNGRDALSKVAEKN